MIRAGPLSGALFFPVSTPLLLDEDWFKLFPFFISFLFYHLASSTLMSVNILSYDMGIHVLSSAQFLLVKGLVSLLSLMPPLPFLSFSFLFPSTSRNVLWISLIIFFTIYVIC